MATLCGTRLVVACDGPRDRLSEPVDLRIEDGRVTDVVAAAAARLGDPQAVDASGTVALPGLVNGHTHSHELPYRGRYPKLPLEAWMLYVRPPLPLPPTTPEDVYTRTLFGAVRALHGGATTIVDDVAVPGLDRALLDAVFRAYDDAGIRALVGVSMFDVPFAASVPFLTEELAGDLVEELSRGVPASAADQLRLVEELAATRHPRDHRVGVIVAPSAPHRCTDEFLCDLAATARAHGVPLMTHLLETRLQAVTAELRYGATMVAHLDRLGVLGDDLSLIHGVWVSDGDVARLAAAGATVQHNPVSNLRLGSGLAPVDALLAAGVAVSLGSDGYASCVETAMLGVVREAALAHALRGSDRAVDAATVWQMGSRAGAEAIGLPGRRDAVVEGAAADLVLFDLDDPAFVPLNDPLRQLVYAVPSPRPRTVVVGGAVVVDGGRHRTVDERGLQRRVMALHARLVAQMDDSDRFVDRLRPAYERICRRGSVYRLSEEPIPARLA